MAFDVERQSADLRCPGQPVPKRRATGGLPARSMSLLGPVDVIAAQRGAGNAAVASALTAQRDPAVDVKQPGTAPDARKPELDAGALLQLGLHDIQLGGDDESTLAQAFPNGFTLAWHPDLVVTVGASTRMDFVRVAAFEIVPPSPLAGGTEAYIFKVGKGRSILLSSIGGRSIMLDAGSGTSLSPNGAGVQRLLAATGLLTGAAAAVPDVIRVSHADSDHYNAVRPLLTTAAFAQATVEVAAEQLRAAGPFSRASLTAQPGQGLVTIQVTGAGGDVHTRRVVVDNMEITEFRSVAAHTAAGADATGQSYDKNRTSSVTVVMDLITGERYVYTADAPGRLLNEVINSVGERGLQRLLGADSRQLRLVELPHHGGEQTGPDAAGLLRFLQLAFESGSGDTRLVTQTSASFAAKPSSAINFLDVAGVAPERIEADPSPGGSAQVVRARGSAMHDVTIDTSGVTDVVEIVRANDTALHGAYGRLAEIAAARSDAGTMAEALARTQAPESLLSSVRATHTALVEQENRLRATTDTFWDNARAAAGGNAGMRGTRDVSAVTAQLAVMADAVAANDPATARNDLEVHQAGLRSYSRVYVNVVQMMAALDDERFSDVHRLRAEQLQLLRGVRAVLGEKTVDEHVRGAWEATERHWTTQRINEAAESMASQVIERRVNTEFRATLGETLARQMQLTELVEGMQAGAAPKTYGAGSAAYTPGSARVTAGAMAAIEIVRVGLDLWEMHRAAAAAAAFEKIRQSREGIEAVNWWMQRGVLPQVALVDRSTWSGRFGIVSDGMTQDAIFAAIRSEKPPASTPSFDKVVVAGVEPDQLRRTVMAFVTAVPDLEAWNQINLSYPVPPAFKRFDGQGWAVRLWSAEDKEYRYQLRPEITEDMDGLLKAVRASQEDRMELASAARPLGAMQAVHDVGWIRTRRIMWAYESGGAFTKINSSDFTPMVTVHGLQVAPHSDDFHRRLLVKAADVPTYELLSQYWWVQATGQYSEDQSGVHGQLSMAPNTEGWAYADEGDVIISEGSQAMEMLAKAKNPHVKPD